MAQFLLGVLAGGIPLWFMGVRFGYREGCIDEEAWWHSKRSNK